MVVRVTALRTPARADSHESPDTPARAPDDPRSAAFPRILVVVSSDRSAVHTPTRIAFLRPLAGFGTDYGTSEAARASATSALAPSRTTASCVELVEGTAETLPRVRRRAFVLVCRGPYWTDRSSTVERLAAARESGRGSRAIAARGAGPGDPREKFERLNARERESLRSNRSNESTRVGRDGRPASRVRHVESRWSVEGGWLVYMTDVGRLLTLTEHST